MKTNLFRLLLALTLLASPAFGAPSEIVKRMRARLPERCTIYGSGSMRPLLDEGDPYILAPMDWKNIRKGMIIVYVPPGADKTRPGIIHEVVDERVTLIGGKKVLICKGLNNEQCDRWPVTEDMFVGVATFKNGWSLRP